MAPRGEPPLEGDHDQRVAVPLPRSLPELQAQAKAYFGAGQPIKMYQNGKVTIDGPGRMVNLKNNDVIVVAPDAGQGREAPPISTHMAHYVKHPAEARPAESKAPKYLVQPPARFEGMSNYNANYVRHNVAPTKPVKAARGGDGAGYGGADAEFYGRSTYAQHFTWHEQAPKSQRTEGARRSMAATVGNFPFEGVSSYQTDFVKHDHARPRSSAKRQSEQAAAGPVAFEGVTTYALDFKKHSMGQGGMSAGKKAQRQEHVDDPVPFEGASEYSRQFLKHDMEQRAMIYIEPALPGGRKVHRPNSAPAGSRRPGPRPPSAGKINSSRGPAAEDRPAAEARPKTPLGAGARPKTPLGAGARPKTPLGPRARPKTPLGAGARPKTPLRAQS